MAIAEEVANEEVTLTADDFMFGALKEMAVKVAEYNEFGKNAFEHGRRLDIEDDDQAGSARAMQVAQTYFLAGLSEGLSLFLTATVESEGLPTE